MNTKELELEAPKDVSETGDYDDDVAEFMIGERSFKPLYLASQWEEPGKKPKGVAFAIALPSGVVWRTNCTNLKNLVQWGQIRDEQNRGGRACKGVYID